MLYEPAAGLSERTIKDTRMKVSKFIRFLEGREPSAALVNEWIRSMREQGREDGKRPLSQVSIQTYVRAVRAFLHWWCDTRGKKTFKIVLPKADQKLIRPLGQEEVNRLVAACKPDTLCGVRMRAIIMPLIDSGIRVGELAQIRLKDVEFGEQGGSVYVLGKGRRERRVVFGQQTAIALKQYIETVRPEGRTDHLFVTERSLSKPAGLPLTPCGLWRIIKRAGKRAGLPDIYPHLLRHSFGTMHAASGTPLLQIKSAMGHRSIRSTELYVHLAQGYAVGSLVDAAIRPQQRGRRLR